MENLRKSFKALKWYEWIMIAIMALIAAHAMITAFIQPSEGGNPPWLTVINFVSAICGIFCIFFTAKAHISNFIFAVINTLTYAVFLWYWKIYGTFTLEILFYLPIEIVSWVVWTKHRDESEKEKTKAKKLNATQNAAAAAVVLVIGICSHFVLVRIGGNVAWLDAFTFSIGIVAVLLELLRYKEQYVWWIITDVIAVAMYIVQFDAVYLTKKTIYFIMAIIGFYNWSRLNRERNVLNE